MLHSGEGDWGASDDFRQSVMRVFGDIGTITALERIKKLVEFGRTHGDLVDDMAALLDGGAVIVLGSGDEVELSPSAIRDHMIAQAERAEEAANEAYYGGDSPGFYGPDDPGPGGR